jgi:hypothetical protein
MMFSLALAPFCSPTHNVQGFQFLHTFANTWFLGFFDGSHLAVVLICIFQMCRDVERVFTGLLAICISSWDRCLCNSLVHILNWIVCFVLLLSCRDYVRNSIHNSVY